MNATTEITSPGPGHNQPPTLHEELAARHGDLAKRRDELLAGAERAPVSIDDDETAGRIQDFIKQLGAATKNAETARVAEKEPHLEAGRVVDGFFKGITEPLAKAKKEIEGRLTAYLRKKAENERRAREEAERKAREEAEARERAAEDAAAQANDDASLDGAIAAEEQSKQAYAAAVKAERAAEAAAADLSRTRSNYGSVGSLRTAWTFGDLSRATLDLESLREHISHPALEQAVRSFIKAGGRELRGVRIFEDTAAVVR
jgi:hypothetical protein